MGAPPSGRLEGWTRRVKSHLKPTDAPLADLAFDLAGFETLLARTRFWRRWFRPRLHGAHWLEGLEGGLLVANHGLFGLELVPLVDALYRETRRPVRLLGDRIIFRTEGLSHLARTLGAVEGHPSAAVALLSEGWLCMVCPGGAGEGFAPKGHKYRLLWQGHEGFVRSALRAGTPLVPLAVIGSDDFYRQVRSSEEMQRSLLGRLVRRLFGSKYVPPVYFGLGALPLPVKLEFHLGQPMHLDHPPEAADDDDLVAEIHGNFQQRLELLLDDGLAARDARLIEDPDSLAHRIERLALRAARD